MTKDGFIIVGTCKGDGDEKEWVRVHTTLASEDTREIANGHSQIPDKDTGESVKIPSLVFQADSREDLDERMAEFEARFPLVEIF